MGKAVPDMLKKWLEHPYTRGLPLDSPATTLARRRIIREKAFLKKIYIEWYMLIKGALPTTGRPVLELGSGAGFLHEFIPELITSEIVPISQISLVLDARALPFRAGSLGSVVMVDVLHHVPQPRSFFAEAGRCLVPGGKIVMVEPWVTPWSRVVYTKLHHEPFDPEAEDWEFPPGRPLSAANGALPWILFQRDREIFTREFPELKIESIEPMMPFSYLLSGGVSMRSFVPGALYGPWRVIERLVERLSSTAAMFAAIVLSKKR
jgi:SAM-dependent methyltransferase